ncbi:hypothetical protein DFA_11956 [Cavenderia fasciculata]|uniref:Uncharacterized protein n=1 Tax=Cavenderia fasciculata TaxID=261658 RepID=F4QEY0_CACFS|nr:uncharacterized protein DFA_11956 [Cavenderia fasciculata]EGG14187.1 hypothetical protein DFA_11956 [Cavenderia fasciculata]|eukprot:XP_004350895.1 hypothetical protein DFA_11956 [Cavenderia fasciculata]
MLTKNSFTEDPQLDILVAVYLVVRIIVMLILWVICIVQLYYDFNILKASKRPFNSRFYVFLNLSLFPLDVDFGSPSVYSAIVATYLLFNCWCFVGCYWMQLLYTFFISKGVRHQNTARVWKLSWGLIGLNTVYMVVYIIVCAKVKEIAPKFYTISFIVLLATASLTFFVNGCILVVQMKRHDQKTQSTIITATRKKTKILAIGLIIQLICLIVRDIIYSVFKISMDDNLRHLYTFITFFFEVFIVINIMIAVSQKPLHYLLLRPVNQQKSGVTSTGDSDYSGGAGGGSTGNTTSGGGSIRQKGFSGSVRLEESNSRDTSASAEPKEKEKKKVEEKKVEQGKIDNSNPNNRHVVIPASILEGYVHNYDIFTSEDGSDDEDAHTLDGSDVSFPIDTPTLPHRSIASMDISMSRSPPLGSPPLGAPPLP